MHIAVPAVLPSSREDLMGKLSLFSQIPLVERIQIDVVDGRFAQPASWPYTAPHELLEMRERGEMLPRPDRVTYEMDLMCVDAEHAAEDWLALGATRLTFHAESVIDLSRLLTSVHRRYGSGANFAAGLISLGVALNIASDLSLIEPCLSEVDYVQFMGIDRIGRQGQPFDARVLEKVRIFRARHANLPVQIDGGVSLETAKKLISLGVTNLIVGSVLTRTDNPTKALAAFEDLNNSYRV